jgi:hypothetical protein
MATSSQTAAPKEMIRGPSLRKDAWWAEPIPTILLLATFVGYATWAAFQNQNYFAEPYLSPMYSPCLAANCEHATIRLFGSWWTLSPAILVLWAPGGFRATCYYYRKAYYRSFFGQPPACAARDLSKTYKGETRFPFLLQNLHRYFFWLATAVLVFLWWDVVEAFRFPGDGFGMGVGTIVLGVNAALLSLYSFSCHSCRHIVGGGLDTFSRSPLRHRMWRIVTRLNARHSAIAWASLIWVMWADVYVRLLATDSIRDLRFF